MWIALLILALLAIVIATILLLRVKVILKKDEKNGFFLRYRFLFMTFGENSNPNNPLSKILKKSGGTNRFEKTSIQQSISEDGLQKTITESYSFLVGALRELLSLFKYCTITQLNIKICCAGEDPAQTAILYGIYHAATHTLLSTIRSFLPIRKRGCNIDIRCDFWDSEPLFHYQITVAIPFGRIVAAFWRLALKEAKRDSKHETGQTK